jgi:hypothetical protein
MSRRSGYGQELDLASAEFLRWCARFGLTPSDRPRVNAVERAPAAPDLDAPEDPREALRRNLMGG